MKKETLDLLERSYLFPSEENPSHSVDFKIHRMDFPFISRKIFFEHLKDSDQENFERYIFYFILKYIKTWVPKNPDTVERKGEHIFDYLFDFRKEFYHEGVLSTICSGDDTARFNVKLNNSTINVKRFGDCLAFGVSPSNGSGNIHETGFTALEEMTKEKDKIINPFFHRIECSIPLPKEHAEENSSNISFVKINEMLTNSCRHIDWLKPIDSWVHEMILRYQKVSWNSHTPESGVLVGVCADVQIQAMLVHADCRDFQKTSQWRAGNVRLIDENSLTYNFSDAGDLRLVLMAHCGNRRYESVDRYHHTEDEQRKLLLVGSMLYTQLCTMFSVYNATHECVLA